MSSTCRKCRHAVWELTSKGNLKRSIPGRCTYPLPDLREMLPMCCPIPFMAKTAIWPHETTDCPVMEEA